MVRSKSASERRKKMILMSPFLRVYPKRVEFVWDKKRTCYDQINYTPNLTTRHICKKDIVFFFTQLYDQIDMDLMKHLTLYNHLALIMKISLIILFLLLLIFLAYYMFIATKSIVFYLCLFYSLVVAFIVIVIFIQNHIKV